MGGLSAAQLAVRKGLIGSSEIGAIIDFYAEEGSPRCDPYKTAQGVFNSKVLPDAGDEDKDHQLWGLCQEPGILNYHAHKHGLRLVPPPGTLVHAEHPLCATPDGIGLRANGRLRDIQAKNAQRFQAHRWGEPGSDDAPLLYVAQLQVELGILLQHPSFVGQVDDVGDLAVCLEGAPPDSYHVRFDPELFGSLATLAAKFKRDHLDPQRPPSIDGTDAAAEYVRRRWEKHVGILRPWSEEAQELAAAARAASAKIKELDEAREAARNKLKHLIGAAAGIDGLCTWKRCRDSAEVVTDWKAVADDVALAYALREGSTDALNDAAAVLAPFVDKHTTTRITKKGSRRLLFTKANGQAEAETAPAKEEEAA